MKKIDISTKTYPNKYTLVDDEDFDWINQWKWYFSQGYARRMISKPKERMLGMHRVIMGDPEGFEIDHINHNTLDNRRKNLRLATKQQNRMNRTAYKKNKSGYKGVYWYAEKKKWLASIRFNKKSIYLGLYENKIDAALAYDQKAKELFCEFAYQNLIHA